MVNRQLTAIDMTDDKNITISGKRPNLGFVVPPQNTNIEHDFLTNSKDAKDWFAGLPLANTGETAKQIYQALKDFNSIKMSDTVRAQIIEMFREPSTYIRKNLEKHYIEIGFPLNKKGVQASQLAIELDNELCLSYKIIADSILTNDQQNFDSNLLVITLHRALYYLFHTLFQTAIIYQPWAEGIWREIHTIYAYASLNHIHQIPIKDGKNQKKTTTIEDLYKSCVLFSTANPARLRQTQIRQLFLKIPEWTNLISIEKLDEDNAITAGQFFLDLGSDDEPHRNLQEVANKSRSERIIDINKLLDQLHKDFEQAPWDIANFTDQEIDKLPKSLIRMLIKGWMKPMERRFARTRLNFELRVIVGLYNIHRMLEAMVENKLNGQNGDESLPPVGELLNPHKKQSLVFDDRFSSLSLSNIDDNDSLLSDSVFSSNSLGDDTQTTQWMNTLPPEVTDDMFCVLTCNESAEGYCLVWKGDHPPKVKVGELVGIQSATDSTQFALGIIRWLKQGKDSGLRLGLHIQSSGCQSVSVVSIDKKVLRKNRTRYHCLLLTNKEHNSNIHQLVTSAINFQVGTIFNMEIGEEVYPIKLQKLMASNGAFAQYEFTYIDQEEDSQGKTDDFSELWSSI